MTLRRKLNLGLLVLMTGCLSSGPDTPESRNQQASLELARQMVAQGEYHRAVQFLAPRTRQTEVNSEVYMLLGLSFIGLNNPSAAKKNFEMILKRDPQNDDALLNIAYSQIQLGRFADARRLLSDILQRGRYAFPEKVHLNVGLSFLQEKKCEKANPEFLAALEIDPTFSAAYFNMGKCNLAAKRYQDARASFQKSVDFCPGCLEPQYELAAVNYRLGDRQKALSQLEAILNSKPDAALEKRVLALRKQVTR